MANKFCNAECRTLADAREVMELLANFEFDTIRVQAGYDKALKAHCALKRLARSWLRENFPDLAVPAESTP